MSEKKQGLFHKRLALLFTICKLIGTKELIMKYEFVIRDRNGAVVLAGAETELRDLVVNGIQVVRDSSLDVQDTRQVLGHTDINNVMHLIRGETND